MVLMENKLSYDTLRLKEETQRQKHKTFHIFVMYLSISWPEREEFLSCSSWYVRDF